MLSMAAFAFAQTIRLRSGNADPAISALNPWNAISGDPYQTRFLPFNCSPNRPPLDVVSLLCNREANQRVDSRSSRSAVASAFFGILRQTAQLQPGFVLPRTMPGQGYGQFINKNHFALLMEMALGLGLGIGLTRGLTRERVLSYVALLIPIWMGLVLSNSRGGILAMLAQVVVASLLLTSGKVGYGHAPAAYRFLRSKLVRVVLLVCLVGVILVGAVWVGGDKLVSSFGNAGTEIDPGSTGLRGGATRNEIWRASWKMFTAHPMLGVGMGAYWVSITAYHDASGVMTPQEAHNDYLELLASGGLVGLAIGIWFVVSLFRAVRVNLASENRFQRAICFAAVLGMTGVAVHSLVDFGLHLLVNAFVFLVLVMFATKRFDVQR